MNVETSETPRLLGRFLLAHRRARGWGRAVLADRCNATVNPVPGISQVSIRFWETGHENRVPSSAQLAVLAEVFGWSDRQLGAAIELLRLDAASTGHLPTVAPAASPPAAALGLVRETPARGLSAKTGRERGLPDQGQESSHDR